MWEKRFTQGIRNLGAQKSKSKDLILLLHPLLLVIPDKNPAKKLAQMRLFHCELIETHPNARIG